MTKMKTYRTLFVTISKDKYHKDYEVHRFPYSSDEKANAAFGNWNKYEHYEHIAQHYYPEDFADTDLEGSDLSEAVCYEIESILVDWNTGDYCPDEWKDVYDIIQAYVDVLIDNDLVVPEWVDSAAATMQSNN